MREKLVIVAIMGWFVVACSLIVGYELTQRQRLFIVEQQTQAIVNFINTNMAKTPAPKIEKE